MELAATGQGGYMSTIVREKGFIYNVKYDKVPLEQVANSERTFPSNWITKNATDVTDDFIKYAKPLIGEENPTLPMINGRQRLTQFKKIFAPKKLPQYTPEADRKK
jgi:6-phosphofructokinase 1